MVDLREEVGRVWPPERLPRDVRLLLGSVGLLWVVAVVPGVRETPLRTVVGVAFSLFVPGYALLAALFPDDRDDSRERDDSDERENPNARTDTNEMPEDRTGIDVPERIALSVATSVVLVPLVGLVLHFTPWGIQTGPVLVGLTLVTVPFSLVAAARRDRLSRERRFEPRVEARVRRGLRGIRSSSDWRDTALDVLVVLSLLLAAGSTAFAVVESTHDEQFTEFYVVTESESDELVAAYPTRFEGETSLVVGIGNHEGEQNIYTVVVNLQNVDVTDGSIVVTESREIDRFGQTVTASETVHVERTVRPDGVSGVRRRLQLLLYRAEPPAEPTQESAYRVVYLWESLPEGANAVER